MPEQLVGTVALVTGASSGIGAATARALAKQGAFVALVARREEQLNELAAELQADGRRALVIETDVTKRDEAFAAVQRTVAEFAGLDIVINDAGVMLLGPALGTPIEEWEQMVDLNVKGLLYIAHAALPHLLKAAEDSQRRVADLVNISSVAGRVARAGASVYDMTKFGVGAFSEALRQEVTKRHVRVSLIEPGLVKTELQSHLRPEIRAQRAPLDDIEWLQAEDIADAIQYIVTRPRHIAINEILIRPTEQEF